MPRQNRLFIFALLLHILPAKGQMVAADSTSQLQRALRHGVTLKSATITSRSNPFGVFSTQMSAVEITGDEVRRMPNLLGEPDVLRTLQALPGVQYANGGRASIVVRGGRYDENQIILDGQQIYNAEHLGGYVTAINSDMTSSIRLYKGAFPAHYGGQLSSVVDTEVTTGDTAHYHAQASLGIMSTHAQLEGPIWRGHTSFNIGARASYTQLAITPLVDHCKAGTFLYDNDFLPTEEINYYDITAKVVHRQNERHTVSAFAYLGRDYERFVFSADYDGDILGRKTSTTWTDRGSGDVYRSKKLGRNFNKDLCHWGNVLVNAKWQWTIRPTLTMTTMAAYSAYDYSQGYHNRKHEKMWIKPHDDSHEYFSSETFSEGKELYNSDIKDYSIRADFEDKFSERHSVRWGVLAKHIDYNPTTELYHYGWTDKPVTLGSQEIQHIQNYFVDRRTGTLHSVETLSLYGEDEWESTRWLRTNIGLRANIYVMPDKVTFVPEPRISLRALLDDGLCSLKTSYARMSQATHLLSSTNIVCPTDLWVPSTSRVPVMTCDHVATGLEMRLPWQLEASAEGYYKWFHNTITYAEGMYFGDNNDSWEDKVVLGRGRAYGIEVLLRRTAGKLNGWIGYAWSHSLRTFDTPGQEINCGREFYADNDCRHKLNVVLMYRIGPHADISGTWYFQTGQRVTLNLTSYLGANPIDVFADESTTAYREELLKGFFRVDNDNVRNGYRLANRHGLDVMLNLHAFHRRSKSTFSLGVYNIYNHHNADYVKQSAIHSNKLSTLCVLPALPAFQYTWRF